MHNSFFQLTFFITRLVADLPTARRRHTLRRRLLRCLWLGTDLSPVCCVPSAQLDSVFRPPASFTPASWWSRPVHRRPIAGTVICRPPAEWGRNRSADISQYTVNCRRKRSSENETSFTGTSADNLQTQMQFWRWTAVNCSLRTRPTVISGRLRFTWRHLMASAATKQIRRIVLYCSL